ncbi:MAG: signal peptidase I [Novosphingobium sp.]|uniref:signal peptidase I n=1 Tax=Novosphingobium sp. TaxID=1874826 RepID=UPI0032B8CABE
MTDTITETTPEAAPPAADPVQKRAKKEDSFPVFLLKLGLAVVIFRSFIFAPFYIPSESMLPRLVNGDYLLLAKWPYGFSGRSLPFGLPLLPEKRILASDPERGDVVVFKAPAHFEQDWIKRVIGLPGDTVQMKGGQLWLNNVAIPKVKIADFEVAVSPNTRCYAERYTVKRADGAEVCSYPRFTETLPGGRSYDVLDLINNYPKDDTDPVIVPEGHVFLMGDNRDNSEDSRFPADPAGGIGLVPIDNLLGRATVMMWSTDGGAEWLKPWTWFSAARWNRLGGTF